MKKVKKPRQITINSGTWATIGCDNTTELHAQIFPYYGSIDYADIWSATEARRLAHWLLRYAEWKAD